MDSKNIAKEREAFERWFDESAPKHATASDQLRMWEGWLERAKQALHSLQQAEPVDDVREAFEAAMKAGCFNHPLDWHLGEYESNSTQHMWEIWQAALSYRAPQPAKAQVPEAKPLPELMMASYHEAIGWNACREAMLSASPSPAKGEWLPMETAPKDGTVIQLLIHKDELSNCIDGEEEGELSRTVGTNGFDNDGEDNWRVVGWSWTHDCFTDVADGINPVGWCPLASLPEPPTEG